MKEQLEKIRQEALGALESVKDAGELDALRVPNTALPASPVE